MLMDSGTSKKQRYGRKRVSTTEICRAGKEGRESVRVMSAHGWWEKGCKTSVFQLTKDEASWLGDQSAS